MKHDLIIGSKFAFLPGVIAGVVKDDYSEYNYERPTEEGALDHVTRYELVVVLYENRQQITYSSEAERNADYEIILQSV